MPEELASCGFLQLMFAGLSLIVWTKSPNSAVLMSALILTALFPWYAEKLVKWLAK